MLGISIFWWIMGITYIIIPIVSTKKIEVDNDRFIFYILTFTPFLNHLIASIFLVWIIIDFIKERRKRAGYKKIKGRIVSPLDPFGEENWEK